MRYRPIPFLLALAFLVLSACRGTPAEPDPDDPRVTGVWSGSSGDISMTLVLIQVESGEVYGNGTLSTRSFVVGHGTHAYPNLSLLLRMGADEDFAFTGELVSDTLISGTIIGSRVYNGDIDLTKN